MKSTKMHKTAKPVSMGRLLTLIAVLFFMWGSDSQTRQSFADENGSSEDFFVLSDDSDHVPNTISFRKPARGIKQLPSTTSKARELRGRGLPVGYDMPLVPPTQGSVIPQFFLEEDSTPATAEPEKLKPSQKLTPPPKPIADTSTKSAIPGQINPTMSAPAAGYSYEIPGEIYGGVYDECSPGFVVDNCFMDCPVVQPFGCGMLDNLTFFFGTTGFRNELDASKEGNFGITEGFNWAAQVAPQYSLSAQFGFRATQSNLLGQYDWDGNRSKDIRSQYFLTGGFFKRDLCSCLQGGVVFDWFQDEYFVKSEMQQVRVELSVRTFSNLEYGFLGGFGVSRKKWTLETESELFTLSFFPQNYYLLFGRKHFDNGGLVEGRVGGTDYGDVILGAYGEFPVNDRLSFYGSVSSLIPKEGNGLGGVRRETHEISVGMIYYFRGGACSKPCNPARPMFDVASNGSFFNRYFWRR